MKTEIKTKKDDKVEPLFKNAEQKDVPKDPNQKEAPFKLFDKPKETDKKDNPFKLSDKPSLFSTPNPSSSNLFGGSLFADNNNKNNLFPSGSLFSSGGSQLSGLFQSINNPPEGGSMFSSLSQNTGGFFLQNTKIGGDDDDEEGSGGEDEEEGKNGKSDSPEPYRPMTEKSTGPYSKKYIKLIDNFAIYDKKEKKYHSKGDGYLSIEYVEEPKKSGVIVFRNKMGNKLFDGIILPSMEKIDKNVKNFKHIAVIPLVQKNASGAFEGAFVKAPFTREEDLNEFENAFKDVISLLK